MPRRMTAKVGGKRWRKISNIRGKKKPFPRSKPRNRSLPRPCRQKREIRRFISGVPGEILEEGTNCEIDGRTYTLLRTVVFPPGGKIKVHYRMKKHSQ